MPLRDGSPITAETVFDRLYLIPYYDEAPFINSAQIHNSQSPTDSRTGYIGRLEKSGRDQVSGPVFDDAEAQIVLDRIQAGECEVRYSVSPALYPGALEEDLDPHLWFLPLLHSFHKSNHREWFFKHLAVDGDYLPATEKMPQRFIFPGIVEGANRRFYKRAEPINIPTVVRSIAELEADGWSAEIPIGPHGLQAIDVLDGPDALIIETPIPIYHHRKDQDAAIVAMARAWHNYWRALSAEFQNNSVRRTLRKHVEHAIGRMWADRPNESEIRVIYEGETGARSRSSHLAEDWMLGNMEQWLEEWGGFEAMAAALSMGSNRTTLESELDDSTFCHLAEDGSFADRLSNGVDGITQATWDAYQDTHYPAAVNHGVETLAVAASAIVVVVAQGETETTQSGVSGGLLPYEHELLSPPAWASIDADTGEITLAPDTTVAVQNHALNVRVTDALGTVVTLTVLVTVQAESSD